jgi:large subunit ribosomal protein L18
MSQRSKNKTRAAIAAQGKHSVTIKRTNKHFEAQILSPQGVALGGATTKSNETKKLCGVTGNCEAARKLSELVAKILKKLSITDLAFDRSGHIYHGRVSAFADGLRAAGVKI